jgi:steroid 5-alpha reductase family enzyme
MIATLAIGWGVVMAGATLLWVFATWRRDVSVIDIWWGPTFLALASVYAVRGGVLDAGGPVQGILLATIGTWALRLAVHIAVRGRGHGEDRRYREMREKAGASFRARSLVTVFWLQATLATLLSVPFLHALARPDGRDAGMAAGIGVVIWLAGFACEAIADGQLLRFQRDPASGGRVMDRGLWRFSRHPNYFGETLVWWGWAVLELATPARGWGALAALAMTVLLLRVSGVPLAERGAESRRPGYRAYVERTSAFVPWVPRARRANARP